MAGSSQLKILSLDGGGIRGLSSLLILKRIMHGLGSRMKPRNLNLQPCDYFDLIGGTSTGGIIAIMLGRLRMSLDECIAEYADLSKKVFSERKSGASKEMFKASKLESAIKYVIRKKLGDDMQDAPLEDPLEEECCHTLVYTLPEKHPSGAGPQALRTYTIGAQAPIPCTIWQAARATSAAPTFFKSVRFGVPPLAWVDAGMGFNNPARVILEEAGKIWRDDNDYFDRGRVGCLISLGTGFPNVVRLDTGKLKNEILSRLGIPTDAIEVMQSIVTNTEPVAVQLRDDLPDNVYYRFNVEQGLQAVELFDYEELESVSADTNNYLLQREREVDRCTLSIARLPLRDTAVESQGLTDFPVLPDVPREEPLRREVSGNGMSVSPTFPSKSQNVREAPALTITYSDFQHYRDQSKCMEALKPEISDTVGISYLWARLVQADILHEEGRSLLYEGLKSLSRHSQPHDLHHCISEDAKVKRIADIVNLRIASNRKIWSAHKLYRALRVAQEECFTASSTDYLWSTHRLAGTSELIGLLQASYDLYLMAKEGRLRQLGPEHKSYMYSAKGTERLWQHLVRNEACGVPSM